MDPVLGRDHQSVAERFVGTSVRALAATGLWLKIGPCEYGGLLQGKAPHAPIPAAQPEHSFC